MPTPELMNWVSSQRRWSRMYKGKRYYVSPRQLGCAETKEASILAANAWWKAKQAELDAADKLAPRTPKPLDDVLAALIGHKPWASYEDVAKSAAGHLETLPPSDVAETLADAMNDAAYSEQSNAASWENVVSALRGLLTPMLERMLHGHPVPDSLREHLPPARVHQIESGAKAIRGESAPTERSVKALSERWQSIQLARVAAGNLAPDCADNNRIALAHFIGWVGDVDISGMDAERLEGFYVWCLKQEWSVVYARKVFSTSRVFIRWLWESNLIELPRNIDSRSFRFGSGAKKIPVWETGEVIGVINAAPGQLKLHLLLMLNCGFTQQDISDLKDSEIDWEAGRIDRTRSKMQDRGGYNVSYKLWPLTWELLQKYRSGEETVLLTESGRPFVRKEMVKGRLRKADGIRSNFTHLKRRLGFTKSMKLLRKTGATLLDKFDPSGRVSTLYLGHSPRSMKDRHYSRPDQERFDAAIEWLGSQFGY